MAARLAVLPALAALLAGPTSGGEWWSDGTLYQIYPRSFKDSDGDGKGDLRGIIQQVDYLHDIGVDTVWLSPFYESPLEDGGYDISNYQRVLPMFGNNQDIIDLIDALHKKGMRLLVDVVPNHTSARHEWFQESKKDKTNSKADFYVWKDPVGWNGSEPIPPNNWLSEFGGPAWTYMKEREQFYLHQFGTFQPDLNYTNPAVVEAMKDVMRFWLDFGLDGFRVDAVPFLVEDPEMKDEPKIEGCQNQLPRKCLKHISTENQPGTYEVMKSFEKMIEEEYKGRYLFLEAYAPDDKLMEYYGDHAAPFNFRLLEQVNRETDAPQLKKLIDYYMEIVPSGKPYNWVVGNHDNNRVASRLGEEFVDAVNMMVMLLPGVGVTYQGDELGMTDTILRKDQIRDCCGRDAERTPFQWDTSRNSGFSVSNKTWLPTNPNYWHVNVASELQKESSHLKVYKKLLALRKVLANQPMKVETRTLGKWLFGFRRDYGERAILVVINLNNVEEMMSLSDIFEELPPAVEIVLPSVNSGNNVGLVDSGENLTLRPRTGIVYQV